MRATSESWSHYRGVCQSAGQNVRHREEERRSRREWAGGIRKRIWINDTLLWTPPWRGSFTVYLFFLLLLCYCKPANREPMRHISALQACALGDGWCRTVIVGMEICTMMQCTLTGTDQPCAKAEYFHKLQCVADIFCRAPCRDLRLTLQSRWQKHTNKKKIKIKVSQGWLLYSFLRFYICSLEQFVPPYWAGVRLPNAAGEIWCQLFSSVTNFLDHERTSDGQSCRCVMLIS